MMPCCVSNARHSISLITFHLSVYYKSTRPDFAGNAAFSQGPFGHIYSPKVRTNNPQM